MADTGARSSDGAVRRSLLALESDAVERRRRALGQRRSVRLLAVTAQVRRSDRQGALAVSRIAKLLA